jgi:hypothetical protein
MRRVKLLAALALTALTCGTAGAATVYKHVDEQGNVTYSEVPPPKDGVEAVQVRPDLPAGRQEAEQERLQRMRQFSSELEESRRGREDARAEQRRQQPAAPPQTQWSDDRSSDRYPYRYFPQRPPLYPGRPPVGVRPPIAVPPIERPDGPAGGIGGPIINRPVAPLAR